MQNDPYRYFRVEAAELLAELGKGVLDVEKGSRAPELVPRLLRSAHTLKGAARVVKQPEIADHAHAIEDELGPLREPLALASRACIDALLTHLDDCSRRLAALAAPAPATPTDAAVPEATLRTLRADVTEVDALLDNLAEVHAQVESVRRGHASVTEGLKLVERLVGQLASPRSRDGRAGPSVGDRVQSFATELQGLLTGAERSLGTGVEQLDRELREARDTADQLRLSPAAALFAPLERAVRDVAQALGLLVVFEGIGGDVRLDAHVLGGVQDALLQVVRNAVAHGIEAPEQRRALGKPAAGRVTLRVSRRARRVVFECSDDGRGVDLDAVRRLAEGKGLLAPELENLGSDELLRLLLRGGLSTAGTVTEVSGRGIGLDVLRDAGERLAGEVSIRTRAGEGTTVELVVPLSLASIEALVVEASGAVAAIPLDAVRSTLRLAPSDVARTAQGESVVYDGTVIPFMPLARALAAKSTASRGPLSWSAVVVQGAGGLAAVGVDRLVGTGRVVLRALPTHAPAAAVVAGVSLDSEGNPQLVLDPDGLLADVLRAGPTQEHAVVARRKILVVDDSLTTRMLEQSILESAGYEVDLATSGEEGLEAALRQRYDLFLVDVEMPGMDGFAFIERTQSEAMLRDVPAILVSSRSAPEDRQRGQDVGARGYIVKGEFAQNDFLRQIQGLLG